MGCGCGRPSGSTSGRAGGNGRKLIGWKVEAADGKVYGPYLTQMEGRQTLTALGGGRLLPVYEGEG